MGPVGLDASRRAPKKTQTLFNFPHHLKNGNQLDMASHSLKHSKKKQIQCHTTSGSADDVGWMERSKTGVVCGKARARYILKGFTLVYT